MVLKIDINKECKHFGIFTIIVFLGVSWVSKEVEVNSF